MLHLRCRNGFEKAPCSGGPSIPVIGSKEEVLVLDDGSAHGEAVLVVVVGALRAIVDDVDVVAFARQPFEIEPSVPSIGTV